MHSPSVLIISCDKYSDMWKPFFQLFWRHWPDCPYQVFLGTNHKNFDYDGVTCIQVGDDRNWADNLHFMLDAIGSSRIIMFLEDFLMMRDVDTDHITHMVKLAHDNHVGCLRLFPHPPPTRRLHNYPGIGEVWPGDDWRVSTQAAIWNVELLRSLAWTGMDAWEFETIGSLLSDVLPDKFWSVYKPALDYCNGVVLGRWTPAGLEVCRMAGVEVDLGGRSVISDAEMAQTTTSPKSLLTLLPYSMQRPIVRWLRLRRREFYLNQMLKEAGLQPRTSS